MNIFEKAKLVAEIGEIGSRIVESIIEKTRNRDRDKRLEEIDAQIEELNEQLQELKNIKRETDGKP